MIQIECSYYQVALNMPDNPSGLHIKVPGPSRQSLERTCEQSHGNPTEIRRPSRHSTSNMSFSKVGVGGNGGAGGRSGIPPPPGGPGSTTVGRRQSALQQVVEEAEQNQQIDNYEKGLPQQQAHTRTMPQTHASSIPNNSAETNCRIQIHEKQLEEQEFEGGVHEEEQENSIIMQVRQSHQYDLEDSGHRTPQAPCSTEQSQDRQIEMCSGMDYPGIASHDFTQKEPQVIKDIKLVRKVTKFRVKQKYFLGLSNLYQQLKPISGSETQDKQHLLGKIVLPEGITKETFRRFLELTLNGSKFTPQHQTTVRDQAASSSNIEQQVELMDAMMASMEDHLVADLLPPNLARAATGYPNLAYHCYNCVQECVAGRNQAMQVWESTQFLQVAYLNRVLEFLRLLCLFRLEDQQIVNLIIKKYVFPYAIKLIEQSLSGIIQDEYLYQEIQLKMIDLLVIVKQISLNDNKDVAWCAQSDNFVAYDEEAPPVEQFIAIEHLLSKYLTEQLARYFQIRDLKVQEVLVGAVLALQPSKASNNLESGPQSTIPPFQNQIESQTPIQIFQQSITVSFLETVIANYCFLHRMLLPRKNGSSGLAVLKIVDLLGKARGIDNVFQLLDNEQSSIMKNLKDPAKHPINQKSSTRIQVKNLQKTFYKELEPFQQEDINWNTFVWRVNADLDSEKYMDYKRDEDEEQQVCRLYLKQMSQLVRQHQYYQENTDRNEANRGRSRHGSEVRNRNIIDLPEDPENLSDLFGSNNGLDDAANYNLENDAHAIVDQMVNQDNANVAEVSIRLRPYIRAAPNTDYFGKEKIIGARLNQNYSREFEMLPIDETQDIDQPTKHLIISYMAQVRVTFLDSEQALFLAQENRQLYGQGKGPNGEELVSHQSLTASDFVHSEMQNLIGDMSTRRTFTFQPQLFCSIFGGKQHNQVADMLFPQSFCFDRMILDVTVNTACVHQMILRYIAENFDQLPIEDTRIGLINYDQFITLLKNKYLNASDEDIIVRAVEAWISGNPTFMENALEHDNTRVSNDQGVCFSQMEQLVNNINWPIVSLSCLMKTVCKPRGTLKQFTLIRKKVFEELQRRQSGLILPKSREMPLRHCQLSQKQAYFNDESINNFGRTNPSYTNNDCDTSQSFIDGGNGSRSIVVGQGLIGPCLHTDCEADSDEMCTHQREREMMCRSISLKQKKLRDTSGLPFMQQLLLALIEQSEDMDAQRDEQRRLLLAQIQDEGQNLQLHPDSIRALFCLNCNSKLQHLTSNGSKLQMAGTNNSLLQKPNILSLVSLHDEEEEAQSCKRVQKHNKGVEARVQVGAKGCQTDEAPGPPSMVAAGSQTDEKGHCTRSVQTEGDLMETEERRSQIAQGALHQSNSLQSSHNNDTIKKSNKSDQQRLIFQFQVVSLQIHTLNEKEQKKEIKEEKEARQVAKEVNGQDNNEGQASDNTKNQIEMIYNWISAQKEKGQSIGQQQQQQAQVKGHCDEKMTNNSQDNTEYSEFQEYLAFKEKQMKAFMEKKLLSTQSEGQQQNQTRLDLSTTGKSISSNVANNTDNNPRKQDVMQREMSFGIGNQLPLPVQSKRGQNSIRSTVVEERQQSSSDQDANLKAESSVHDVQSQDDSYCQLKLGTSKKGSQNLESYNQLASSSKKRGSVFSQPIENNKQHQNNDLIQKGEVRGDPRRHQGEDRSQKISAQSWNISHFLNGNDDTNQPLNHSRPPQVQDIQCQVEYREPRSYKIVQDSVNNSYIQIEAPPYGNHSYVYPRPGNQSQLDHLSTPLQEKVTRRRCNESQIMRCDQRISPESQLYKESTPAHVRNSGSVMPSIDSRESLVDDEELPLDVCDIQITDPEYPCINEKQDVKIPVTFEPGAFKTLKQARVDMQHQRCHSSLVQQFAGSSQVVGMAPEIYQFDSNGAQQNNLKYNEHFQELFPVNAHGSHGSSFLRFVREFTDDFNKVKVREDCLRTTERQMYTDEGTECGMLDGLMLDQQQQNEQQTIREGFENVHGAGDSDGEITQGELGGNNVGQRYEQIQKALGKQLTLNQDEDVAVIDFQRRQMVPPLQNHYQTQKLPYHHSRHQGGQYWSYLNQMQNQQRLGQDNNPQLFQNLK